MPNISPIERLEAALSDTSGVYVNAGVGEEAYLADLRASIRRHICKPFQVSAEVMEPGFEDVELGDVITGLCVAHDQGEWLVYQPQQDRFYCFWGPDAEHLGARGVVGSPLYCWSA
ncbi:MAG TPA: hypothetical protein VFQ95_07415 [Rhodanobacteraceae bacterium]|nr:hypothetical protein [Rhodanobacteraceae bacterium]